MCVSPVQNGEMNSCGLWVHTGYQGRKPAEWCLDTAGFVSGFPMSALSLLQCSSAGCFVSSFCGWVVGSHRIPRAGNPAEWWVQRAIHDRSLHVRPFSLSLSLSVSLSLPSLSLSVCLSVSLSLWPQMGRRNTKVLGLLGGSHWRPPACSFWSQLCRSQMDGAGRRCDPHLHHLHTVTCADRSHVSLHSPRQMLPLCSVLCKIEPHWFSLSHHTGSAACVVFRSVRVRCRVHTGEMRHRVSVQSRAEDVNIPVFSVSTFLERCYPGATTGGTWLGVLSVSGRVQRPLRPTAPQHPVCHDPQSQLHMQNLCTNSPVRTSSQRALRLQDLLSV